MNTANSFKNAPKAIVIIKPITKFIVDTMVCALSIILLNLIIGRKCKKLILKIKVGGV